MGEVGSSAEADGADATATPIVTINPGTRKLPRSVPPPPSRPPSDAIETIGPTASDRARGPPKAKSADALLAGKRDRARRRRRSGLLFALRRPSPPPPTPARHPPNPDPPAARSPAPWTPTPTPTPDPDPAPDPDSRPSSAPASSPPTLASSPSPSSPPSPPLDPPLRPAHLPRPIPLPPSGPTPAPRVSIDGTPRGHCLSLHDLSLDPGPHDIRFTFEPTGESRGERLTLRPSGARHPPRRLPPAPRPTLRVER